jgi:hypothetical protein
MEASDDAGLRSLLGGRLGEGDLAGGSPGLSVPEDDRGGVGEELDGMLLVV